MIVDNLVIMKGVVACVDNCDYWYSCLYPEHKYEYLTVDGDDYMFCPICNIKWCVGQGIHDDLPQSIALSDDYKRKLLSKYEDFTKKWVYWWDLTEEQQRKHAGAVQ